MYYYFLEFNDLVTGLEKILAEDRDRFEENGIDEADFYRKLAHLTKTRDRVSDELDYYALDIDHYKFILKHYYKK